MQNLMSLFGESPFEHIVQHARKVHECVNLLRPITDALLEGNMPALVELQDRMAKTEYEADLLKDEIRRHMPRQLFLPVDRGDILNLLRQLDRVGDDAEDFAVIATFRKLDMPLPLRPAFSALVNKIIQTSEAMLALAEDMAIIQKDAFEGAQSERVLTRIEEVCRLEWESDRMSRDFARSYYSLDGLDPVFIMLMDKLCRTLSGVADHAENVGKTLRLMILRH